MPIHGNSGFKIGVDAGGPTVTPETRSFTPDPVREKNCIDFLKEVLPTVSYTKIGFLWIILYNEHLEPSKNI